LFALLYSLPIMPPPLSTLFPYTTLFRSGMTASNFGGGDLFARNAPQDGFLSIIGMIMPATWVVKALMVFSALGAAAGAWRLSNKELVPTLAAIALAVANPFVIERLLQGHWSVVIAA